MAKNSQGVCRYDIVPQIDYACKLGCTFGRWWLSMQPSFHVSKGDFPLPVLSSLNSNDSTDAWAPLRKLGQYSFLCVMMLLRWWSDAAERSTSPWEDDSQLAWRHLVADVANVVEVMTTTFQGPPAVKGAKRSMAKENVAPARKGNKR